MPPNKRYAIGESSAGNQAHDRYANLCAILRRITSVRLLWAPQSKTQMSLYRSPCRLLTTYRRKFSIRKKRKSFAATGFVLEEKNSYLTRAIFWSWTWLAKVF